MRNRQYGITLTGLIFGSVVLVLLALLAFNVIPAYVEYFTAVKTINAVAKDNPDSTPAEVRRAFELREAVDDIPSLKPSDLDITKEGGQNVISFAYRKEVPLFTNVGLYFDFKASTRGR
ncbi:MAG TPA: DUF4845 domain-containing protein [Burkholderiales bacterium]|nr:DUF4845 domain-containing protein [Burkholderiales bacterium]HYA46887.1 DUF4845 domain-containing protein [Burkholderiales bacterium]